MRKCLDSVPEFLGKSETVLTTIHFYAAPRGRSMFIQTMQTPNPASLMFVPGVTVMEVRGCRLSFVTAPTTSPTS